MTIRQHTRWTRALLLVGLTTGLAGGALAGSADLQPPDVADRGCSDVTWIAGNGDWSDSPSWSSGSEPTAGDCVTIADSDTVEVTMQGETCAELALGTLTSGKLNLGPLAGLAVVGLARIGAGGIGTVGQIGGSFTADRLEFGAGGWALASGTVEVGSMLAGATAVGGGPNITGGAWTVTGDLELDSTALMTIGGGEVSVGQGGGTLIIGGRLTVSGAPTGSIEAAALTMTSGGVLGAFVSTFGLTPIAVTGTAQLAATLSITDFSASDGTYDVIVAGSVQGSFDTVQLPSQDWSWGITDNHVWIRKGDPSPTEVTSWGAVKEQYRAR